MKQGIYTIKENIRIAQDVFRMVLSGDTSANTRAGQFVNIAVDGCYLRRPISVCDWNEEGFTIIYKAVGKGTEILSAMNAGGRLDLLTGLGNGFDMSKAGNSPLLIGGGLGAAPMYGLAKSILKNDPSAVVTAVLGFNTKRDIVLIREFEELGVRVETATLDGSGGIKGFVTDVIEKLDYSYFFACGPLPMLKAVDGAVKTSGQLSFEERMGCGFGACMGCTCKTKYGNKRICKDGPVLEREEIIW